MRYPPRAAGKTPPRAPRLVYVVTHPVSADALLRGQLAFMRERGFDVTVVSSPGSELERVAERERVRAVAVPMERRIRFAHDASSLVRLMSVIRSLRPDIVNASTPKAGLLGMLSARALSVPVRIYLLRGLRLETATGTLRRVLSSTERIASACADEVICVSPSLREAAVAGGHIAGDKAHVIGAGSSNGVDPARWEPTAERLAAGRTLARAAGIADEDEVIGFVGRFDRDKGIGDLLTAFARIRDERPRTHLLLVGGGYADDVDADLARRIQATEGVVALRKTDDLAPLYARMDVLAFPSYREGFPNVVLEAACAELPAVGYQTTGVVDAIANGESGTIVRPRDISALGSALIAYLSTPQLRDAHGAAARKRASERFGRIVVWKQWEAYYRARLAEVAATSQGR